MKAIWILPLLLWSCQPNFRIEALPVENRATTIESYAGFCELDSMNPELAAVRSAIFGEQAKSLHYATINENIKPRFSNKSFIQGIDTLLSLQSHDSLNRAVSDSKKTANENLKVLAEFLTGDFEPKNVFKKARAVNAKDYILSQVSNYDFVLINEAHYSSQHREFAASLLSALYHQHGFRYLAPEALSSKDSSLERRGYANIHTGYYIDDPSFGNMINEALRLGAG